MAGGDRSDIVVGGSSCGDSSRINSCLISSGGSEVSESSVADYIVSPGGMKYYFPSYVGDISVPFENQVFDNLNKGFNDPYDEKKALKKRCTVFQRCGCEAKMILKYMGDNKYFIKTFVELHNHPLASETGRQFVKANREMNISLRTICFDASKVNIGVSKSFYFAKEMAGGYGNVGANLCDFRNFSRDIKSFVGERDGQMIIDKFKVIQETSESFYFAYEVDFDGHLTKLFWVDAIGQRNFELYGDAVSFDATFDTNKYNMILAPFTGVDKHDKCVTFAACLLSHENIEDYTWAFDHFVKAMGRNPVVILTDQCPAMKVAVHNSFSDKNCLIASKHRLCMWHIMQKFRIKRLMSLRELDEVLKEFKLDEHNWLSDMYSIRSSWIPSFFRDDPMFGLIRTTSRSEGENFFFGQFHRKRDTLCEFWLCFQSAMERQRNETERPNHESKTCIPETLSTWFIEDDAATLFTRAIFYTVQEEIISSCLDMQIKRMSEEINGVTHLEIRDVKVKDKLFKVTFFTGFKKVDVL
ncbi:protein FAR1-RELATED SEQUENCE 5-like [Apium graveolens]|uniref:protein FAR1-RELATED SEQUENCE 5-like n=1 Tax=Apium graveolens TaxID=4045 RepID=UPI003D7A09F4